MFIREKSRLVIFDPQILTYNILPVNKGVIFTKPSLYQPEISL
jgi:hypothetical protein